MGVAVEGDVIETKGGEVGEGRVARCGIPLLFFRMWRLRMGKRNDVVNDVVKLLDIIRYRNGRVSKYLFSRFSLSGGVG